MVSQGRRATSLSAAVVVDGGGGGVAAAVAAALATAVVIGTPMAMLGWGCGDCGAASVASGCSATAVAAAVDAVAAGCGAAAGSSLHECERRTQSSVCAHVTMVMQALVRERESAPVRCSRPSGEEPEGRPMEESNLHRPRP